ncbi:MAG: quinone oxidoreductase family protein [Geminicoccales bacterium]
MTYAIRIHRPGTERALKWEKVKLGKPGPGELLLRQTAIGLNFIDVYHRTGLYKLPSYPATIGTEAAGIVEAVGPEVHEFKPGDRVAYAPLVGAYAQQRLIPAARVVKIPEGIADEQAAAMMLKGMTAQYLIRRTYRVQKGEWVLLHAAAGGVGSIAAQWLKHLGARVIGTAGGAEKVAQAEAHGCEVVIDYNKQKKLAEKVREITEGAGVAVVYDGVGKSVYKQSLDSIRPLGTYVNYGNASGPIKAVNPLELSQKGSLYFTRPTLMTYTARRDDLVGTANELFQAVLSGAVTIEVKQRYPLKSTAQAHRDLEARKTTGSTVLLP